MLEKNKNVISKVVSNSKSWNMGIEEGDILLRVNNEEVEDIIEYMFLTADEYVELEIKKDDGSIKIYRINKEYDEDLGIVFQNPIIDKTKNCMNNCIFCFIDQLPPNMRKTLYFKDDDSRLSFLQGNFVTLTNMSDDDINKIIRFRISPINVSIHTTDPLLRIKMLKNKKSGNVYERLEKLASAGIRINGQIVLCPNVNDRKHLDKTINDLAKLYPNVSSLAVVPVGITKFRKNLYPLIGFTSEQAKEVINQVQRWQMELLETKNTRFVFLSDEFYILSNKTIPQYHEYEGFPQLENGVGLTRKFEYGFMKALNTTNKNYTSNKTISVVTGKSAEKLMVSLCKEIENKIQGIKINVYPLKNHFFGESINVAGLITGKDIIDELKHYDLGNVVFIPNSMLKADESVFLDDFSVSELSKVLHVPIVVCSVDGNEFVKKIIEQIE